MTIDPDGFKKWYERFCIEGPAMSTEELMREAFIAGGNQTKAYPAKDFYGEDGTLKVSLAPNLMPMPVDSTDHPSLNLKRGIKISKKELDKLIEYSFNCGFPVKMKVFDDFAEYSIDHPYYECTPLAESCLVKDTNRWTHWMFIRL